MLKRSILSVLILCHISFAAFSQPIITVGKPYKVIDGQSKFYFYKDNELLSIKKDEELLYLQKLNTESLSYVSTNMSRVSVKGFEFIKEINGRYFMFYSGRGLFVKEIVFKTGNFKDEGKGKNIILPRSIAGNATTLNLYGVSEKASRYNLSLSNDKSRMAIQYRFRPEIKADSKSYETIGLHVFDSTFQELSSCTVTMPYTEKKMDDLAYTVDSKGNVYIVISVYKGDSTNDVKMNSEERSYHLEILKVTPPSSTITAIPVNHDVNFIKTIRLFEDTKGVMTCVGFYNNGKKSILNGNLVSRKSDNVDGIIQFKLSPDNAVYDFKSYEIPLEILNQYVNDRTREKNIEKEKLDEAEFENLFLRNIIFDRDRSMVIISEQAEKITHYNPGGMSPTGTPIGGGAASTSFSYKDLLITKIDSTGDMLWMKRLPKASVRNKVSKTFYYLPGANNEHYFLFLDDMKNFELPMNERHPKNFGQGNILMAFSINDETGKVKKIAILDIHNLQGMELHQFTPDRIEALAPSVFVFEAYKEDGEDVLIKVDLSKLE